MCVFKQLGKKYFFFLFFSILGNFANIYTKVTKMFKICLPKKIIIGTLSFFCMQNIYLKLVRWLEKNEEKKKRN